MKLLTRTTVLYICITILVFSGGSVLFYHFLQDLVDEETTEALEVKKEVVLHALLDDSLVENSPLAEDVNIRPADTMQEESITDTLMYDEYSEEELPYRILNFSLQVSGKYYSVSIRKEKLESDDLIEGIFISFLTVLIILAVVVIVLLQVLSRRMWKPFFTTLQAMKEFRPGEKNALSLPVTTIREFKDLNAAIEKMVHNTEAAFQSLKSFSENAAHEIQTPLAVIQSTIEVLQQDEKLTEEQHKTLGKLSSTSSKLSGIVTTLLLLTRIENKQFQQEESINFSEVVSTKTELMRELFEQRRIQFTSDVAPGVMLKLHKVLSEILVSNLLVNAIRHTPEGGSACVTLGKSGLVVRNSGLPLKGDPSRIFERFYKEDQSEQSTGLGLSLVKMVADTSGLTVKYAYQDGNHIFSVHF